jgi:hypothetical protein
VLAISRMQSRDVERLILTGVDPSRAEKELFDDSRDSFGIPGTRPCVKDNDAAAERSTSSIEPTRGRARLDRASAARELASVAQLLRVDPCAGAVHGHVIPR